MSFFFKSGKEKKNSNTQSSSLCFSSSWKFSSSFLFSSSSSLQVLSLSRFSFFSCLVSWKIRKENINQWEVLFLKIEKRILTKMRCHWGWKSEIKKGSLDFILLWSLWVQGTPILFENRVEHLGFLNFFETPAKQIWRAWWEIKPERGWRT